MENVAVDSGNNGNKKWYKRPCFWSVLVILVVLAGLWWFGYLATWTIGIQDYFEEKKAKEYLENQEQRSAELQEMYKNDTYGGDTPEETWAMFVDALKKGDTGLASKYFVPEKQDEMEKAFEAGKENGANVRFLEIAKNISSGIYYENNDAKFQYTVLGTEGKWDGVVQFTYDLVLNPETNKWKISEL